MYIYIIMRAPHTRVCMCVCVCTCVYVCMCVYVRACVCSRRQDSGGAANVGALCRLVNARRDVTGHARLTKWTSFAKSAPQPPPKYIFFSSFSPRSRVSKFLFFFSSFARSILIHLVYII